MTSDDAVLDVAVIGGGIAGATACVALARRGVRPLWVAPPQSTDDDRVGESLAPTARPILASLGLDHLLDSPRHRVSNATFSAWGGPDLVERHGAAHAYGPGLVIDRRTFEADLVAEAGRFAAGRPAMLRSARTAYGLWHLTLDGDGCHETVRARFVIDASGRNAVLGRRFAAYSRDDRMVAAWSMLPHRDPGVDPTPATMIEASARGWFYATLLPDGRLSLAYFSDPDLLPARLSRDVAVWRSLLAETVFVSRWIDDAGFAVVSSPTLASAGVTRLDPPADGDLGWAAVGDATAAFDPLSSHGMATALWTAAQAGAAAVGWLEGDRRPLHNYAAAVSKGAERFSIQRAEIYGRETRFLDEPFWSRRRRPDRQGASAARVSRA